MRPGNEEACALDAAFFKANPDRKHCCRYALTSEVLDAVGYCDSILASGVFPLHILVQQIEPGLRSRALVGLRKDFNGCDEQQAAMLFEEFMSTNPTMLYDASRRRSAKTKSGKRNRK